MKSTTIRTTIAVPAEIPTIIAIDIVEEPIHIKFQNVITKLTCRFRRSCWKTC